VVGDHLLAGLRALMVRHERIGDVRGLGLMIAVDLVKDRATREPDHDLLAAVLRRAWEKGLVLLGCGASSVRIAPPLIVDLAAADAAVAILDQVLAEV
jgi:4-aminobutyrate aminotransferase